MPKTSCLLATPSKPIIYLAQTGLSGTQRFDHPGPSKELWFPITYCDFRLYLSACSISMSVAEEDGQLSDDLKSTYRECRARRLHESSIWCLELLEDLGSEDADLDGSSYSSIVKDGVPSCYQLALAHFDSGNYMQTIHILSLTNVASNPTLCFLEGLTTHKLYLKSLRDDAKGHTSKLTVRIREFLNKTEANEMDPFILLMRSTLQNGMENYSSSCKSAIECLTKVPFCLAMWEQLGQSLVHQRAVNLRFLERIPRRMIVEPLLRLYLAGTWEIADLLPESLLEEYKKNHLLMQSRFARLQVALIECRYGRYEQAAILFQEKLRKEPYDLKGICKYSDILFLQGRREELKALTSRSEFLYLEDPVIDHIKGNLHAALGDHEISAVHFRKCTKHLPLSSSPWILLGQQYLELRQAEAAIDCYRRAVEVNPCDFRGWIGLGQVYELLNSLELSLEYYSRAAQLAPSDYRILLILAKCFQDYGRLEKSLCHLEKAFAACPVEAKLDLHLRLGNIKLQMGRAQEALDHCKIFLEGSESKIFYSCSAIEDPLTRNAITLLVQHYEAQGDLHKASRWLSTLSRSAG